MNFISLKTFFKTFNLYVNVSLLIVNFYRYEKIFNSVYSKNKKCSPICPVPHPLPLATTFLLSMSFICFYISSMRKIIWYFFFLWFTSLSIMPSRSQMEWFHSFLWMKNIPLYIYIHFKPFIYWWLMISISWLL